MNKYLNHSFALFNNEVEYDSDMATWEIEEFKQFVKQLKGRGIEVITLQPDDPIDFIFDDGKLKLVTYISTRGSLYQAGAYDGEKEYFRTNLSQMHDGHGNWEATPEGWAETDSICGSIAKEYWEWFHNGCPEEEQKEEQEINPKDVEKLSEKLGEIIKNTDFKKVEELMHQPRAEPKLH